ncbi:spore cortex-lytic enzyme [Paenibacillus sp. KN14-4R]|uniref:spore cortex-lytic enzyme n=1 Tax=Paenibacillus sp. KN14-4R TaxID=3445773 RepID=UPI003FA0C376
MNKRIVIVTICIVLLLFAGVQMTSLFSSKETFSKEIVKYGSKGSDVFELQGRLKFLGFYFGEIDGDFGNSTLKSVKWFQSEFGMPVDGLVGGKTKVKLWEATKAWKPSGETNKGQTAGAGKNTSEAPKGEMKKTGHRGYSEEDINLIANAVYGESRGEPYEGQVAVAAVILNRVDSASFPNTVHGVIFQPLAFTAVADGQIWLTPNETAKRAVLDALNGMDPTDGCLYYFNPKTATSKWIWSRPQFKTIGEHIFCR